MAETYPLPFGRFREVAPVPPALHRVKVFLHADAPDDALQTLINLLAQLHSERGLEFKVQEFATHVSLTCKAEHANILPWVLQAFVPAQDSIESLEYQALQISTILVV